MTLYEHDPDQRPDSEYEAGELRHLVAGNEGRMLDPRRTPVRILSVAVETGFFELRIEAFEDEGAVWLMPFEKVGNYQFATGSPTAGESELDAFRSAIDRFSQPLHVTADRSVLPHTNERIGQAREEAREWLRRHSRFFASGAALPDPETRMGSEDLMLDLEQFLGERNLAELDDRYATQFVSNPYSGEEIKGLRIVLAELGVAEFHGTVIRDERLFEGEGAKEERARYLITRLGFVRALFAELGRDHVLLFRGYFLSDRGYPKEPPTFLSASFHRGIAESLAGAAGGDSRPVMLAQATRVERIWMSYLETRAMNRQFREAEAVLLYAPDCPAF